MKKKCVKLVEVDRTTSCDWEPSVNRIQCDKHKRSSSREDRQ